MDKTNAVSVWIMDVHFAIAPSEVESVATRSAVRSHPAAWHALAQESVAEDPQDSLS